MVNFTIKTRKDQTRWITVGKSGGPYFQCDYYGSDDGPVHTLDFEYDPPDWVVRALDLEEN